jgi:DNA-directed RNA polymerase specialized sigma24 family protein
MSNKQEKSASFFRLYNSIHTRLYSLLLMMVHNEKDAEDLLQETATILWISMKNSRKGQISIHGRL